MILVTRLNQTPLMLNSDLIEHVEIMTDTVIMLTNGQSWRVRETASELLERIVEFRRRISGPGEAASHVRDGNARQE